LYIIIPAKFTVTQLTHSDLINYTCGRREGKMEHEGSLCPEIPNLYSLKLFLFLFGRWPRSHCLNGEPIPSYSNGLNTIIEEFMGSLNPL
jgi:hypothetical protein